MRRRVLWRALQGAFLGSGAPIGWAVIQTLRGVDLAADIPAHPILYLYMLVGTAAVFACFGLYVGLQESYLQDRSRRDPLTKLFNIRHFREQLDGYIAQSKRDQTPVSLIFFDLDHFKKVNDNYGHAAGDQVLIEISTAVSQILRKNELFARVGGEEFAIIAPHGNAQETYKLAERIRVTGEQLVYDVGTGSPIHVTLSLGISQYQDGDTASGLLGRADAAMYEAKRQGRNRTLISENTQA